MQCVREHEVHCSTAAEILSGRHRLQRKPPLVMPVWASALVTAGALGVLAGVLAADGFRRINASVGAMGYRQPP
jgi:hypothetical protein